MRFITAILSSAQTWSSSWCLPGLLGDLLKQLRKSVPRPQELIDALRSLCHQQIEILFQLDEEVGAEDASFERFVRQLEDFDAFMMEVRERGDLLPDDDSIISVVHSHTRDRINRMRSTIEGRRLNRDFIRAQVLRVRQNSISSAGRLAGKYVPPMRASRLSETLQREWFTDSPVTMFVSGVRSVDRILGRTTGIYVSPADDWFAHANGGVKDERRECGQTPCDGPRLSRATDVAPFG